VIKYGVIEDAGLFALLEQKIVSLTQLNEDMLIETIATSCAIKARVVEADEREDDYRAVLNFGHTIGHALEAVTGYTSFSTARHGRRYGWGGTARQGFCDAKSFGASYS
jgi:3-dehydroquinate synthase